MNITRVPASMPAALAARDAALRRVERTDRVAPSVRSHGSPKPVWRSLLYRPVVDGQLTMEVAA